ncbi:MAG: ATP-binding protein [Deltaproteobacteria bacterium]|nr:ATP-binding protein [Deltaproteobacteria bacterium]
MKKIETSARIEHLERLIEFISKCATEQGFDQERTQEMEVATEEILVNIFSYAYPEEAGKVQVSCTAEDEVGCIIEVMDDGIPFNILSLPDPDVTSGVSDRKVGGLGVFLVRELVNEIRYRRDGDRNILTLVFHK